MAELLTVAQYEHLFQLQIGPYAYQVEALYRRLATTMQQKGEADLVFSTRGDTQLIVGASDYLVLNEDNGESEVLPMTAGTIIRAFSKAEVYVPEVGEDNEATYWEWLTQNAPRLAALVQEKLRNLVIEMEK